MSPISSVRPSSTAPTRRSPGASPPRGISERPTGGLSGPAADRTKELTIPEAVEGSLVLPRTPEGIPFPFSRQSANLP